VTDALTAYVEVQRRLVDLVGAPGTDLAVPAPACPGWSAHDVLAHHVGVVVDVAAERLPPELADLMEQWRDAGVQAARDTMTQRQVDERRGRSVASLCDEWRTATDAVAPWLRGDVAVPASLPPFLGFVLVNDLIVHETDIRGALGAARAPESPALSLALAAYSFSLEHRIRGLGLPALELAYDGKRRRLGDEPVGAVLAGDRHELVRVLAGRRDREQVLAMDWDGDPTPFVDVLSEYGPVVAGTVD
jgi:uncharacterized protein (TIGR03083 family)